jgi:hypothetical protein
MNLGPLEQKESMLTTSQQHSYIAETTRVCEEEHSSKL